MTTKISEHYPTHQERNDGAENCKISLFSEQCADHLENTTFLSNNKVVFVPDNCTSQLQPVYFGITHAFKCHYRRQVIQKTAAMIDAGQFQDAA
jgi:hypothetical protein